MSHCRLLTENPIFKPFNYPWAFEAWKVQQQMHWMPEEVPMAEDVRDWKHSITEGERNLLTQIFRFFTQADVEVGDCYNMHYAKIFKPVEIKMMLTAFSNMETIHMAAYSHLLDTIGMPETEYSAFMSYKEMKDKYDYLHSVSMSSRRDIAKTLAIFGAFTEGLSLFASFAMLMNFPRHNKMKGMGQIVTWSIRDESLHCENVIKLFRTFIEENLDIWDDELKAEIYEACRTIVAQEDAFIDLAFEMGPIQGLSAPEMKQYIRCIADRRLIQLGLKPNFGVKDNPLPWLDEMLNAPEFANFFEQRVTEYSKSATKGNWEDSIDPEAYVIYGKEGCVWCVKAKELCEKYDLDYEYKDLTDNDDLKLELYSAFNMQTVPMITKKDGTLIGGYTELVKHLIG